MGVEVSNAAGPLPIGEVGAMRTAVAAAAISSAVAGLIHVAAARNHDGDTVLLWMFVVCAAAQLAWGVAVAARPTRRVLLVGLVLNGGAVVVWALTRTVGIPAIDALSEVEAVGRQDLGAAMFAAVSVASSLLVLVRPTASRVLTLPWVAVLGTFALVAAVPSLSAAHTHEHGDGHGHHGHDELAAGAHGAHDHGDEEAAGEHAHEDSSDHGHDAGGSSTDGHDHGEDDSAHHDGGSTDGHLHDGELVAAGPGHEHSGTDGTGGHDHPTDPGTPDGGHDHPTDPGTPDDGHDHPDPVDPEDPIISLDDPRLTPEQWAAAVDLIVATTSAMRGYVTEEDIVSAGYVSIGDGGQPGTYEHFVNWSYLTDGYELDPAHIESIVMKMNADGTSRVVSGMYILSLGKTMADVPDIAGSLTTWHDHDNLCFSGTQLVDIADNGVCEQGTLVNTPPMLHVWVEANPCGPFAAIDEHGDVCDATHTH
jgi:hypothetical protein